jgi:hypothetical protein
MKGEPCLYKVTLCQEETGCHNCWIWVERQIPDNKEDAGEKKP